MTEAGELRTTSVAAEESHSPGQAGRRRVKGARPDQDSTGQELKIESRAGLWIDEAKVVSPDLEASPPCDYILYDSLESYLFSVLIRPSQF